MISKDLNVAVVEYDIAWGDKQANMKLVADAIARLPHGIDLVVLPEMFSTGFMTESRERAASLAERNTQETIGTLQRLAQSGNVAIAGSFLACLFRIEHIVRTAGQFFNDVDRRSEPLEWFDNRHDAKFLLVSFLSFCS